MRVLVRDDDPAARYVAKRWLSSGLGCTVTDCEDGVEALELLSAQPFDLVLIDVDLPRLSGVEVVEAIRANELTRELPVVILSQERREDVVRALVELGVSAYLLKPLRERVVLGRIGPLISTRRASQATERPLAEVRLAIDAPALFVDGDPTFRDTFTAVAGQFGAVIPAESGAEALATFRRSPVEVVFVGAGLGIMRADVLIPKIREVGSAPLRLIGVGLADDSPLRPLFDGTMARAFVPETLLAELRPFVRVPGPLPALEALAPQFASCLASAITQVLGAVGGLEAAQVLDGAADEGASVVSSVTVEVDTRHRLELELVLMRSAAAEVSRRLLSCEPHAVDDQGCLAAGGELMNMIGGRLDAWLKERDLTCEYGPPQTQFVPNGAALVEIAPQHGFCWRFLLPDLGQHAVLRARLRQPVEA